MCHSQQCWVKGKHVIGLLPWHVSGEKLYNPRSFQGPPYCPNRRPSLYRLPSTHADQQNGEEVLGIQARKMFHHCFINQSTLSSKCSSKAAPSNSGINSPILVPWPGFWSLLCFWVCFLVDSWFVFPFLVFLGFSSLFDPADWIWQTKRIKRQISYYI